MSNQIKHFKVEADSETGEWIGTPELVGMVDSEDWNAKQDTDASHFDTYEYPIKDETDWPTGETETRAIEVVWMN